MHCTWLVLCIWVCVCVCVCVCMCAKYEYVCWIFGIFLSVFFVGLLDNQNILQTLPHWSVTPCSIVRILSSFYLPICGCGGSVQNVWGCVDENVICNMYDCVVGYFGFCQECVVVVLRMQDFYVCFEYTGLLINNECVVLCFRWVCFIVQRVRILLRKCGFVFKCMVFSWEYVVLCYENVCLCTFVRSWVSK